MAWVDCLRSAAVVVPFDGYVGACSDGLFTGSCDVAVDIAGLWGLVGRELVGGYGGLTMSVEETSVTGLLLGGGRMGAESLLKYWKVVWPCAEAARARRARGVVKCMIG